MAIENLPHTYRVDDTLPRVGFAVPWDLTGWTVQLLIYRPDDELIKTGTITDPFNDDGFGVGHFTWVTGDLVAGWRQKCILRLIDPSGGLLSAGECFLNVKTLNGAT